MGNLNSFGMSIALQAVEFVSPPKGKLGGVELSIDR